MISDNLVTNIDLSKKLNGCVRCCAIETEFIWAQGVLFNLKEDWILTTKSILNTRCDQNNFQCGDERLQIYPAFLTDELLPLLPPHIKESEDRYTLTIFKNTGRKKTNGIGTPHYSAGYRSKNRFYSEELPDALGNLLLWVQDQEKLKQDEASMTPLDKLNAINKAVI